MSGSLGVGYPSNSLGRFPNRFWKDKQFAYEALKANFYQISDLMSTKKSLVKVNRHFPISEFQKEELLKETVNTALVFGNKRDYQQGVRN